MLRNVSHRRPLRLFASVLTTGLMMFGMTVAVTPSASAAACTTWNPSANGEGADPSTYPPTSRTVTTPDATTAPRSRPATGSGSGASSGTAPPRTGGCTSGPRRARTTAGRRWTTSAPSRTTTTATALSSTPIAEAGVGSSGSAHVRTWGRSYRYVGPIELKAAIRPGGGRCRISSAAECGRWIAERSAAEPAEPFTFVVGLDGTLRLAPRRSEHVACAGGAMVLNAGEIGFVREADRWAVSEVSNQSTGYCPDVAVGRLPRCEVVREVTPRDPGAVDVEDGVHDAAQIVLRRPADVQALASALRPPGSGRGPDQPPASLGQVAGIRALLFRPVSCCDC